MKEESCIRKLKITLTGIGFTYSFIEVKDEDLGLFSDSDKGVYLRSLFKKYIEDDRKEVTHGHLSHVVRLCTVEDNADMPAEIMIVDGSGIDTYMLRDMPKWVFVKSGGAPGKYSLNFPENMPAVYLRRLNSIFGECLAHVDKIDKEAINDEYVTYFNMYGSSDRMLLCMRTRDNIRGEFELDMPHGEWFEPKKLCVFMRKSSGLGYSEIHPHVEYDANNIVYNDRWVVGTINSRRDSNTDYFVAGADPRSETASLYESWASCADSSASPETNFRS